jgi:Family of unknown function (DUF5681)
MTKKSRERKSPSGSGKSLESGSSSPVGYGKPPQHSQFKKGVSGNSKGRPKGRLNLGTVLQTELDRPITIREGDRSRKLSKGGAFFVRTINSALNNDPKAGAILVNLLRAYGIIGEPLDDSRETPLTQNDEALLADFLERELEGRNQPGGNGDDRSERKGGEAGRVDGQMTKKP